MHSKKIIFMGTPLIAKEYLNTLIENNIKVEAVFTQPPKKQSRGMKLTKSPVHELAIKNNINVFHPIIFDIEIINQIKKIEPELIIVMAYGHILPKSVLELPNNGCINIHLSIWGMWYFKYKLLKISTIYLLLVTIYIINIYIFIFICLNLLKNIIY